MSVDTGRIPEWIPQGARVLDLGCGEGHLLAELQTTRAIQGLGLELDPEKIATCLRRGLNVVQQDLNQGLSNFKANQFDTIIMTQTLKPSLS
jgi:Predicted O-methyltransferase